MLPEEFKKKLLKCLKQIDLINLVKETPTTDLKVLVDALETCKKWVNITMRDDFILGWIKYTLEGREDERGNLNMADFTLDEKEILLKAMDLLVETENDAINYSGIYAKLRI